MSTYSSQCSAVGSFAYAGYFKLYVELVEKWVDSTNNNSYVDYNVYCQSSGSGSINSNHYKYFAINGEEKVNITENVSASSPNAYIPIASGTIGPIYHDNDGRKTIGFYAEIQGSTYGVSASIENSFELTQIPRYTTVNNSERGKTVNSISVNWSTTDAIDWTQYSLNGGDWQDAYDTVASDHKSGYYTISGLNPNTQYSVKTRGRRADSQLWSEAGAINITTYDIAKISSAPDFIHGDNEIVTITNPGNINNLSLAMKIGNIQILTRNVSTGNNTITFSDNELDNIYKKYSSSDELTATFILTGAGYTNSKNCKITFTGNHKTIRVNLEDWKRGKVYIKVNETWKHGVVWTKEQGIWKRGI